MTTLSSQRFCLRWNNHQSNLLSVFDQLLHDESFVDVTLAVEGRFLRAHKMVLSACSPYFQALFVGHPDKHPIVILKDVPFCDMRSLLDFMYRGEVSVDQDRLTAFLKVAESLRIKGLTEVNEEKCDLPSITSSLLSSVPPPVMTTHTPPPPHLHRIHPTSSHKRSAHLTSANPLLGSALTAPKRKRGRPRKLSGSSAGPPNLVPAVGLGENSVSSGSRNQPPPLLDGNGELETPNRVGGNGAASDIVQGSPEMLEVKMSMDFQHSPATSAASPAVNRPSEGENGPGLTSIPSPDNTLASSKDMGVLPGGKKVKEEPEPEPEPTPGTSSQDPGQAFLRPSSAHEVVENYALDSSYDTEERKPITFELCSSLPPSYHHPSGSLTFIGDSSEEQKMSLVVHSLSEETTGVHFLSHEGGEDDGGGGCIVVTKCEETDSEELLQMESTTTRGKHELLEYLIREDGSVVCKWCGEVLPSRTHWYRHKYKFHVPSASTQPASLFKCHWCNVFFKSRKGYVGHIASRHGVEEGEKVLSEDTRGRGTVGDNTEAVGVRGPSRRSTRSSDQAKGPDYEKQREKEEKLVADIIDRVRRECEAQGEPVTRRGYSRRSTVMNS